MDPQSSSAHAASDSNTALLDELAHSDTLPEQLRKFEDYIQPQGGVPSSFSPSAVITPHHREMTNASFSIMTEGGAGNSNPLVSALGGVDEGGASQSSCQTVAAGNLKRDREQQQQQQSGAAKSVSAPEAPSSNSKKKSTPSKRPASAIGDRSITPINRPKKTTTAGDQQGNQKKARKPEVSAVAPAPEDDKSIESSTQLNSESSLDASSLAQKSMEGTSCRGSASRDTILYHYSTSSNPASRGAASRMASPPALQSSKVVANKAAGQKTIQSFFGGGKKSSADGGWKSGSDVKEGKNEETTTVSASATNSKQSASESAAGDTASASAGAPATVARPKQKSATSKSPATGTSLNHAMNSEPLHHLHTKISNLQKQLDDANAHNKAIKNNQTTVTTQLQTTLKHRTLQLEEVRRDSTARMTKAMDVIERLVREEQEREAKELRQKLASDGARLGRLVSARVGPGGMRHSSGMIESWEDGHAPLMLKMRRGELRKKRVVLEKRWEEIKALEVGGTASQPLHNGLSIDVGNSEVSNANDGGMILDNDLDRFEAKETVRMHLDEVKKEEMKLDEEERALNIEKRAHVRALKLVANEDSSKFRLRHKVCLVSYVVCFLSTVLVDIVKLTPRHCNSFTTDMFYSISWVKVASLKCGVHTTSWN